MWIYVRTGLHFLDRYTQGYGSSEADDKRVFEIWPEHKTYMQIGVDEFYRWYDLNLHT